jgi:polysaccharide biosynthesis/export protein
MKLPLRTVSGFIWVAVLCAGQTGAGAPSALQANPAIQEVAQNSEPPGKPGPAPPHPIDAVPAVPDPARAAADPAKPAVAATAPGAAKPYVIGPLDVLDVNVWNDAKLSHIYDVSPDGTISMPLIGVIKADGLTGLELAASIRERLLQVLNTPEVNVQVVRNNSKKFYILGAVIRQGEFPLIARTTVLDAFANSGGFKDFANLKKIRILRGSHTYYFNYKDASKGKHMEQNIVLENGDHIFVDE